MYEFTEDCLIHIDEIDDEHRRLFQMLNEAIQLADESADVTPVANNLIANLKDYAAEHTLHTKRPIWKAFPIRNFHCNAKSTPLLPKK